MSTSDFHGRGIFTDAAAFAEKAAQIRAIALDWDGVVTSGYKDMNGGTLFSEADAMGISLMRYGYYLKHRQPVKFFIITGEQNPTGIYLSKREHFDAVFMKAKDKVKVLPALKEEYGIQPEELLFIFDDVLDLSLAERCNLRMMVKRTSSPAFTDYVKRHRLADYFTAHEGGQSVIRECTEVVLEALGLFDEVITGRMNYSEDYKAYVNLRSTINPSFYSLEDGQARPIDIY